MKISTVKCLNVEFRIKKLFFGNETKFVLCDFWRMFQLVTSCKLDEQKLIRGRSKQHVWNDFFICDLKNPQNVSLTESSGSA